MYSHFAFVLCIMLMNAASSIGDDDLCASEQFVELRELGIIQCNFGSHYYGAFWYNTTEHRFEDPFLYYKNSVKSGRGFVSGEFDILPNGSLIINNVTLQHEHLFRVFMFLEEESDPTVQYDVYVKVVALPVPPHLLVTGCTNDGQCTIKIGSSGSLTCSVKKIRPYITLQWRIVHEEDRDSITFSNHLIENTLVDDVYDVTLTSKFRVERTFRKNLTMECITTGQHSHFLHYQRGLSLVLLDTYDSNDTVTSSASDESIHQGKEYIVGIVLGAAIFLAMLGVIIFIAYKKQQHRTHAKPIARLPEETPLTDIDSSETAVEVDFVRMLRNKYRILWCDVRPVQIDQHKHFQVNELFCDNNIQFLKTELRTGNNLWKKVDCYHNVIDSVKDTGTVVVIEGDAGYGKTMISLKLVQDWCEHVAKSSLEGIDVVIFFRVNQLTGFSSLYDAIQSVLLPKDSNIPSTYIKKVLKKWQSVVIILDDYEEIHQELVWLTDILKKDTLQHCKVVITTRSFEFVDSIVKSSKRFRLTAFSEETRKAYICKFMGKHDKNIAEQIKTELLDNVVLNELCKIPLLLVAYIHMVCESCDTSEPQSAQTIIRYLFKCFEQHHQVKSRHHGDDSIKSKTESPEKGKVIDNYLTDHETASHKDYKRLFRRLLSTESKKEVHVDILAELYAGKNTENMNKTELEHVVKMLNLNKICFLPLFASCFNEQFFDIFINYHSNMRLPVIWLKYELTRKLPRSSLTKFSTMHVDITTCENLLLQRSKIEMLKLASKNKIPIEDVSIANCVDVEMSTKDMLIITSGMEIPVLETVKKLTFDGKQTKIKIEEAKIMLMYCSQCEHLETVQCRRLIMPWSLEHCTNVLRKDIKVRWKFSDVKEYELQMDSGLWKDLQHNNILRKKRYQAMMLKNKFGKSPNELDEVDTVADAGSSMND